MNGQAFLVRVAAGRGSIERMMGTLRRKSLVIQELSLFPGPRGAHEVLMTMAPTVQDPKRVAVELENLVDVEEVRPLGDVAGIRMREMAVVRVPPGSGPFLGGLGRVIEQKEEGDLLEVTGSPQEIDAVLAELSERDVLSGYHRTGAIPAPEVPTLTTGGKENDADEGFRRG